MKILMKRRVGSRIESRRVGSRIESRRIGSRIESRRIGSRIESWTCLTLSVSLFSPVIGYYCDHNLCSATEEYCCGDNLCCDYANSWWYFWVTVLLLLLLISLIWGLIGFFCLESLGQHHNLFSRYLHKLVLRTIKSRNDSKWFEDPESSLLSRQGSPSSASGDEKSSGRSAASSVKEKTQYHHSGRSHHLGRMEK